ncbi:MAG: cytochrome c biogenesis protein CcsA [Deltaproteobacteria bacterium]|nr:cytochrome c biogenesis protein CcsA [Deltaproteobacteria bacterium]
MWNSLPEFGTGVLCAILVAAAYTFTVALAAGGGRPRLLQSARSGAYGTIALVGLAVLVLAYAFVSHDFRLDYVARYSDRTMSTPWLIAALWGGQDGSLLWWLFLTALFSGACVAWLKGRYRDLQPYVIATQMSVLIFLAILMLFAANPFRTQIGGATPDGAGLNYQLRNFYMIIHPPSLYIGFTSAAVPFSFAIAALVTGRLDNEWIIATRKWMLFSWLFLSIGNALGMLWAYEELGWGGYWAWDPVENAAFLPWLTASAYVHSTMIQERRGMLKTWNVVLICLTFFLTYFGTFLTRSGLIASVHAFAQSSIGNYFAGYMILIVAVCTALILRRADKLKSEGAFESWLSREFTFLINNWGLVGLMVFIALATVWPRLSEWLLDQKATVGPTFYNAFIPPVALVLIFLMGTAPLLGWRKTSERLFYRSFTFPIGAMVVAAVLHLSLGERLGFPAFVAAEPVKESGLWLKLAWLQGKLPLVTMMLVAYNLAVVSQEFYRGIVARQKSKPEGVVTALLRLVSKSRRRYGGYIVHVGIAVMFFGFAGRAWGLDKEASLLPNETMTIGEYTLTYKGTHRDVDHEKTAVVTDIDVAKSGAAAGSIHPARFIYKASPGQPSTEIGRFSTPKNDLYVVVGMINPETKAASVQAHVNPLVSYVWLGVMILIAGALVAMWPEPTEEEAGAFGYVRALGTAATMVMLSVLLALAPSYAYAQQQDMRREGVVEEQTPKEKSLFSQLLCDCGTCPHEPLSTCTCGWAHDMRATIRAELAKGKTSETIIAEYAKQHGNDAVQVQVDSGGARALWALPLVAFIAGGALVYRFIRKRTEPRDAESASDTEARDAYDERLDDELKDLDEDT